MSDLVGSFAGVLKGAVGATPVGAAARAIGGAAQLVGSFIGGRKRRREQRAATSELAMRKQKYEQLDTSNPYQNITNPYVNLTVNTQAADFAAQQSAQGAANIMNNLASAAGGGGIAALAQSLANSQNQQAQQASASIAQQESRNQALMAQGAARVSAMEQQAEQSVAYGDYLKEQNENQTALYIMQLKAGRDAAKTQFDMNECTGVKKNKLFA